MVTIATITTFTALLLSISSAMDYTNKICLNDKWKSPRDIYSFDHWDLNGKPVYRDYMYYIEGIDQIDFNTDKYERTSNKWGLIKRTTLYGEYQDPLVDDGVFTETLAFWCIDNTQPQTFIECKDFMHRYFNGDTVMNMKQMDVGYYFTDCGDAKINKDNILVNIVIKQCKWAFNNGLFTGEKKEYRISNTNTCSEAAKKVCDGQEQCEFLVTASNSPECIGYSTQELNNYSWTCQLNN